MFIFATLRVFDILALIQLNHLLTVCCHIIFEYNIIPFFPIALQLIQCAFVRHQTCQQLIYSFVTHQTPLKMVLWQADTQTDSSKC